MEIISSLNPNIIIPEKKDTAARVQEMALHAQAIAAKVSGDRSGGSLIANKLGSKLKEVQQEAVTLQNNISRVQSEQVALRQLDNALTQPGTSLAEIVGNATFNGEPLIDLDIEQLREDPGAGRSAIQQRLDQLATDFKDLSAGVTNMLVKSENILASIGPAVEGTEVSGLVDKLKNSLQQGDVFSSSLSPEGVSSLI